MSYLLFAGEYNVSREYIYSWDISADMEDIEYIYSWNIAEPLQKTYVYSWDIAETMQAIYIYVWNISNYISRMFTYAWSIAVSVSTGVGNVRHHFRMTAVINRFLRTFRDR